MSNQVYQRPLSEGHIISAVKDFDVYQINPVKVSRRNGINYVFDGQHIPLKSSQAAQVRVIRPSGA